MNIAKFFREAALYLVGTGLFFMLFVLAYFLVFTQVTSNPDQVKRVLAGSGAYGNLAGVVYDEAVNSKPAHPASIPLKDSAVRQAVLDTFDQGFVQKNAENAIDGIYGWLNGKTSEPQFSIDLKAAKDNFAKDLSDKVGKRLKGLPVCTPAQQQKIKEIDPFSDPCRMPGTDITAVKKQVRALAAETQDFLEQKQLNADTLKNSDGKSVFADYSDIPEAYQLSRRMPYLIAVLCLVLGASMVFIAPTRREGLKKLGKLLVISGVFVALVPFVIGRIIEGALKASTDDKVASQLLVPIIDEFSKAAGKVYFAAGVVYILLAVAIFLALRRFRSDMAAQKRKKSA